MNQKQIDLTMSIIVKMVKPLEDFMRTSEHDEVVNANGGYFLSIFISIISSVLSTAVMNFLKDNNVPNDKFIEEYRKLLEVISFEAINALNHRLTTGSMH